MSEIYLENYLCRNEHEFKHEFEKHFRFQEDRNGTKWQLAHVPLEIPIFRKEFRDAISIHVWDDSPFSMGSDSMFEFCLRYCKPEKNFFVWYENGDTNFFKKLVESRFSICYPNTDERNEHIFLINPKTNAGMDKLVEAVKNSTMSKVFFLKNKTIL